MMSISAYLSDLDGFRLRVPLRNMMLRHRFTSFVVLTMLIQQLCLTYAHFGLLGYGLVMKFEMLGPAIAACFMIWLQYGSTRVAHTLVKLTKWRVHPIWYFHSLAWMPLAAYLAVVARNLYLGEPPFDFPQYWGIIPETGFFQFLGVLAVAVSEEIAWFGYGFAVLYARYSAMTAALITGFFWGVNYIPMWVAEFWIAPGQPLWTVIVSFMAWALVCGWIYNATRSAFLLALMQIASNYSYSVFLVLPHLTGEVLTVSLVTISLFLMGMMPVMINGREHMSAEVPISRGEWDSSTPPAS